MNQGITKYKDTRCVIELKYAIIEKLQNDNQLSYAPDEVIVTTGAKQSLYTAFQAILNDGDEVIIPAPYWVSYTEQVKLSGGVPEIVDAQEEKDRKSTRLNSSHMAIWDV